VGGFPIQNLFSEVDFLPGKPRTYRVGRNGVGGYMKGAGLAPWGSTQRLPAAAQRPAVRFQRPRGRPGPRSSSPAGSRPPCRVGRPRIGEIAGLAVTLEGGLRETRVAGGRATRAQNRLPGSAG